MFSWCLVLALFCAASSLLTAPVGAAERQTLRGHVPSVVSHLTPLNRLSSSKRLDLAIGLPLRNKEALTNLLQQLSDPASPQYRHYLTPEQFTAQFGPAAEDYSALIGFARNNGFSITRTHPNRVLLDVKASVADIERTLHVKMYEYRHPTEARTFYACDAGPSLDLTTPILTIRGLNNYQLPRPGYHLATASNTANGATPAAGSGPAGNYMGRDFRAAYVPGTQLTGAGQVVGLLQFDGYDTNDIVAYEKMAGLPNVTLENVLLDGYNGVPTGNGGEVEVSLDIEMVISMAPGVSKVIVYEAGPFGFPDDVLNAMATENRAQQLSASWSWGGGPSATTDQILQQMIAQGQTFFHCTMDWDAYLPGEVDDPNMPLAPCDSPYAIQVGGTTLTTSGPEGAWVSEKVWNWGNGSGSCGGISAYYALPPWQQGISMVANQGSATNRNVPDVALTADNVFVIADSGTNYVGVGGTSCATPLWAGFTALVNQLGAANNLPPVGFINPTLYQIGKGTNYANCFHDVTVGDNTWSSSPNLFFAVPGYDLCTGWGTPAGTKLMNAILWPPKVPAFTVVSNYVFGGNGNGIIDFNECNSLNLTLANVGNADATGVSATLSTTTPGVAIAQTSSSYPNIPTNGLGTNLIAFKVSTPPTFPCGTTIDFLLLVQCDQTVNAYFFSLPSGVPGTPIRFDNSSPVSIPSPGVANSPIVLSNVNFAVDKVSVSLFVPESFDYYLQLELVAPDGTTNLLSAYNGLYGMNYGLGCPDAQRTTFDDAATLPIASGVAPFVGSFKPTQPLSIFSGKSGTNVNGVWQLRATDQGFGGEIGSIQCWSLFLTPRLCSDGGGECPGADLALGMSALPNLIVAGNNLTYSIAVTNNGPSSATNVTVTYLLPPTTLFLSASGSQGTYAQSGGLVVFNLGSLGPRATATMTVVVLPTTGGTIIATATAASEQPDFNPGNNSATVQTRVSPATADLAVTLGAAPSPGLVGTPLTYTVSLANNGPSPASGITVTNALPANATFLSATGSLGSFTIVGNVAFWNLPGLPVRGTATATIVVLPSIEGSYNMTAMVGATQFDPIPGNNTATATTVIGPSSDVAVGIAHYPDPVVAGSNITYVISATNFGPSTATSVTVNDALPVGTSLVSANPSQGSATATDGTLIWNVGTLSNADKATITVMVATTVRGSNSSTCTIIAAQADPNPANNTATATTVVAAPFVSIAAATATLTAESITPTNGAIDIGETVSIILRLRNAGNLSTRNLVATLATNSNVTPVPPNNSQTYGVLAPSGFPVGRSFAFTANGTNGQTIYATLLLHDGTTNYPAVNFAFTLPNTYLFGSTNVILIPDPAAPNPPWPLQSGPAKPYPSTLVVSNLTGLLGKVTVGFGGVWHTFAGDINALLVAPGGGNTLLMSHAGSVTTNANVNLVFDDDAPSFLSDSGSLVTGSYKPTAYEPDPGSNLGMSSLPTNAPAGPYSSALSTFNGVNPNGTWSLFVFDDGQGDAGAISNGWSLALTMITPVNQIADLAVSGVALPNPCLAGEPLTYTFTITNNGPNTATSLAFTNNLPAGMVLVSAAASQGIVLTDSGSVVCNLGTLPTGTNATVTVVAVPTAAVMPVGATTATLVNTAAVAADQGDLNPGNNSVAVGCKINRPVAEPALSETVLPNPLVVGYYLTNTVAVTNGGPGTALNVVLKQVLPTGAGFVWGTSTLGTCTDPGGTVTCALGDMVANATATVTIVLTNSVAGLMTNRVTLTTDSTDTNPNNNSATYVTTVITPAPAIINAGAVLTYESGPVNGAVDPGETVTCSFVLANVGALDTANLKAALAASGGVTSPTGPQYYGTLIHGGPSVARSFGFKAASSTGLPVVASLQLQDERPGLVTNNLGTVTITFSPPSASGWSNSAAITIPDHGIAAPYPSSISVTGLVGRVSKATVTLNGFTHKFPHDVDIVLVSPSGTNVLVMSHTGGGHAVTDLTLTFDDAAASSLQNYDALSSGTSKPTSYQGPVALPGTAPAKAYQFALSSLNWGSPNGAWSLYVFDDTIGDDGNIARGWNLNLTTLVTIGPVVDLGVSMSSAPASLLLGNLFTNTISVANLGPDMATGVMLTNALPAGVAFVSAQLSQGGVVSTGGGAVVCSLGNLAAGASALIQIVASPSVAGSLVLSAAAVANEENLTPANSGAQTSVTVTSSGQPQLSGVMSGGRFHLTVLAQPSVTLVIQGSTNLHTWLPLSTNTVPTSGTLNWTDNSSSSLKGRYYRTTGLTP
jgi:uncharacterized repeat protein (TIGR01451 family)